MRLRPTAADFNRFFRGKLYGAYPIFTARSFTDFVHRNDVDRARAINHFDGTELIGSLLFAQRGERAWFGLIGVAELRRSDGLGKRLVAQALESVVAAGARSVELEIVLRNERALALVRGFGFTPTRELVVWSRRPRRGTGSTPAARALSEKAICTIVRPPFACWQREPRSVARAGHTILVQVPRAYAFVRTSGEFATILDAGADDPDSARALLDELDSCVPHDLTLNNEPAESPLSTVLARREWRAVERQLLMRVRFGHHERTAER